MKYAVAIIRPLHGFKVSLVQMHYGLEEEGGMVPPWKWTPQGGLGRIWGEFMKFMGPHGHRW